MSGPEPEETSVATSKKAIRANSIEARRRLALSCIKHYFKIALKDKIIWDGDHDEEIRRLVEALIPEEDFGIQGTGACICSIPPKYVLEHRAGLEWAKEHINLDLDHRCPRHGETAQPGLWGRHKELKLIVSWKEWESLGIDHGEV